MFVREQRAEKRKCDTEAYSLDEAVGVIGEHIHGEASVMTQPEARAIMEDTYQDYLVELSSLEYDAFNLFNNGNAISKIAEELGYKEEQIRNALYRCSKKFRDIFKQ